MFASYTRKEHACTESLARAFLTNWPDAPHGWIVLGSTLASLSRYDEARQALLKAIRIIPPQEKFFALSQMGLMYEEKGSYRIAERWFCKSLSCNPKSTTNLVFLGACLAKQGRFTEAKRHYRRAIKVKSKPPDEAWFNLGLVLRAEGNHDDALECFENALKIDPKYSLAKRAAQDIQKLKKMEQPTTASRRRHRL